MYILIFHANVYESKVFLLERMRNAFTACALYVCNPCAWKKVSRCYSVMFILVINQKIKEKGNEHGEKEHYCFFKTIVSSVPDDVCGYLHQS